MTPMTSRSPAPPLSLRRRLADAVEMLSAVARALPALSRSPIQRVLLNQIHLSGNQCLPLVAILGVLTGLLIVTEIANIAGQNVALSVKMLSWTVLRELGPLFVAVIVVARSCSAIASELAAMKVHGEIANLERMGVSPIAYLVMPRLLALELSLIVLTIYFDLIALGTGLTYIHLSHDIMLDAELEMFLETTNLSDIHLSFFKALVFAAPMAIISCRQGLLADDSPSGIPKAASQAVVACLVSVFVWDVVLTLGAS